MSLIFILVIIAIAWLSASWIDGLAHIWGFLHITPQWFTWLLIASAIAWFIGEPRSSK